MRECPQSTGWGERFRSSLCYHCGQEESNMGLMTGKWCGETCEPPESIAAHQRAGGCYVSGALAQVISFSPPMCTIMPLTINMSE